jgi:peroxiredoxin
MRFSYLCAQNINNSKIIVKMKKGLLLIIALSGLIACSENNLSIKGTVEGEHSGKVYLQKFDNKMFRTIASTDIKNGKFDFSQNVEIPEIYGLSLDTAKSAYLLFLDGNPVKVTLNAANYFQNTKVTGSSLHDLFMDYGSRQDVKIDEFIKEHPASLVAAYVLYREFSYRLSPDEIRSCVALLDASLQQTPYVHVLNELAETLDRVAIGKPAPDFTLNTPDGTPVKFSDKLGKGYVLLDFWASWCGPCRRENPNVVNSFNKYKDKGFDVFGVSLDSRMEAWTKAIDSDKLAWTNVSDLKSWNSAPAKLYGVRAIPSNILIDPSGVIVAKNLRAEELDRELSKLYSSTK